MKCSKCNAEIADNAKFCPKCGAKVEKIEPEKVCPNCGALFKEGAKFCVKCGCKIENYNTTYKQTFVSSENENTNKASHSKEKYVNPNPVLQAQNSVKSRKKTIIIVSAIVIFALIVICILLLVSRSNKNTYPNRYTDDYEPTEKELQEMTNMLHSLPSEEEKNVIDNPTTTTNSKSETEASVNNTAVQEVQDNLTIVEDAGDYINTQTEPQNVQMVEVDEEEDVEPVAFAAVENKPEYPGGDMALMKYLAENTKYPETAKENGISGKVFVQFIIDKKGIVTNVKVIRGVDPAIDAEAVRVVKAMPNWKPGSQRGKVVPVIYQFPINFKLN